MNQNNTDWFNTLGSQLIKEISLEIPTNPPIIQVQKTCVKCKKIFGHNNTYHEKELSNQYNSTSGNFELCIDCIDKTKKLN